eukprot:scaffold39690_cov15-Tisochrysis_lutea.AAC.1
MEQVQSVCVFQYALKQAQKHRCLMRNASTSKAKSVCTEQAALEMTPYLHPRAANEQLPSSVSALQGPWVDWGNMVEEVGETDGAYPDSFPPPSAPRSFARTGNKPKEAGA